MEQGQTLVHRVNEAFDYIQNKVEIPVSIGIILGTGLGKLAQDVKIEKALSYNEIPHFPTSTVESHVGRLLIGKLMDKSVVVMQGRFHYYEGYSLQDVTFPVRIMKKMGVKFLLLSNVAGGLNPLYSQGDLMIMDDHINLLGDNPLRGLNHPELGPRFPDMSEPYNKELITLAESIARKNDIKVHRGVYIALTGPSLETRAEYRFLRQIGADVVGMSSVPECIVANQCGMKVFGMTVITDMCFPDSLKATTIEEIISAADQAEPKLTTIMKGVVKEIKL